MFGKVLSILQSKKFAVVLVKRRYGGAKGNRAKFLEFSVSSNIAFEPDT